MARKPTLSPSRFTTYLACPAKYKWSYVDERGKWYMRSKSYFSFGTTLHKVLQRFHDTGDVGVQTASQASAAMEESWIDAGYLSSQEMFEALGEGKSIVESYVEAVQRMPESAQTIFVEKTLRMDMGDFVLLGRIDRIDEHEDGSLEIIDYKSGHSEVTQEEVDTDLAMACYQLLLKNEYPDRDIRATIISLRFDSRKTTSMPAVDMDEFRNDLLTLGTEILNRDYEFLTPMYKGSICDKCDFAKLCSKHDDWIGPNSLTERGVSF